MFVPVCKFSNFYFYFFSLIKNTEYVDNCKVSEMPKKLCLSGNHDQWAWGEKVYFSQCWDLIYLRLILTFCYVPLPMNPLLAQTFCFVFSITSKRSYGMSFIKKFKHINKFKHSACGKAIFADLLSYERMNSFTLKK